MIARRRRTPGAVHAAVAWSALACIVAAPRAASAQGNAFGAPIGVRSALMGNTGTALAVDGSAPFLNPATIVRLDEHRFAFSVNFDDDSLTHFDAWHQPGPVDTAHFGDLALPNTAISSSGFSALPSSLCLFFTTAEGRPGDAPTTDGPLVPWRQKLSICLASLENQGFTFTALPFSATTSLGQTAQSQSLVPSWNRLYAGPSYSVALSERLAIGASLHAVFTSDSFILDSNAITAASTNGGVQSAFGAAGSGTSIDLSTTLGAIYQYERYTVGLSAVLPAAHLTGSYTGTLHNEYATGTAGTALTASGSGTFSAAPPVRIALGLGAKSPRTVLEADASVDIPAPSGFSATLSGSTVSLAGTTLTTTPLQSRFDVAEHVAVNGGLGVEYFVKPTFSVIGGASVNLTAQPPLSPSLTVGNLVQHRESRATLAAGIGSYGPSRRRHRRQRRARTPLERALCTTARAGAGSGEPVGDSAPPRGA